MRWLQWLLNTDQEFELIYRELSGAMMITRFAVLGVCLFFLQFMAVFPGIRLHGQQSNVTPSSIYVQQAVTQQEVIQQAALLAKLQSDLDAQRTNVATIQSDLSTVRGIAIGAAAVIGLLQTLQMILQVKAVKRSS